MKLISKKAVELSIEGGWKTNHIPYEHRPGYPLSESSIAIDPTFWSALGKSCGWGDWSIPWEKFEHEWELDHYLPDTNKTEVFYCKKVCGARRINNIVEWDNGYDGLEEWESEPKRAIWMTSHGSYKRSGWKEHAHDFYDLILTNATQEQIDAFWKGILQDSK